MIEIIPGFGLSEPTREALETTCGLVAPFVRTIQINVADNTLVKAGSFLDFAAIGQIIAEYPQILFEAHILSTKPETYVRPLVDAGFKRLIAHVECNDPRRFLHEVKYEEIEVVMALDGMTELEILEPFIEEVDAVLVMTAEAGALNMPFLPEALEKVKVLRQNYPDLTIEVSGGVTDATIKAIKEAGATRIVSSQYIFRSTGAIGEAIEALKDA